MLNAAIKNKLPYPELRLLYDSKMPLAHSVFRNELKTQIKAMRTKYRSTDNDILLAKFIKLGNKGGWYKSKSLELAKCIFQPKNAPADFIGQWRSIEFELVFKSPSAIDDFVHDVRCVGYAKYVTVKDDGSLRVNEGDKEGVPKEVVVTYRSGNERAIREICKLLKGRAYVNKTCGTHVHFDMRHVSEAGANIYGARLARCVPALRLLLPKSRRSNKHCAKTISTETGNAYSSSEARYAFVNMLAYKKHKTIEIRGHSGTINANKMLGWIQICEKIMITDPGSLDVEVTTLDALIAQYALDNKEMRDYITERYSRFNASDVEEGEDKLEALEARSNINLGEPVEPPHAP